MMGFILDHLWQSTLLALGLGLLTLAFRRSGAAVRYGLWLAASTKFLVPFAPIAAVGKLLHTLIPAANAPMAPAAPGAVFVMEAAQPFSQSYAVTAAPIHAAPHLHPVLVLGLVWALGCAAVLVTWAVRWARVRAVVRSATPLPWPAPMPVLASPTLFEPGLVGLWRAVLIVPASLPDVLGAAEMDALVAHEACHLRRRDNLAAAVHMLVEALFWFHPLVWWIGARLIAERERACDEAVVRSGCDRRAYARTLLESCRLYLRSPLPCVAGASGSNLKRRVQAIMTGPTPSPLARSGKALLLALGACAAASPVAAGWLASPGRERTPIAAAPSPSAWVRVAGQPSTAEPAAQALADPPAPSDSAPPAGITLARSDAPAPAASPAVQADIAPPASIAEATATAVAQAQPDAAAEEALRRWIASVQLHQPDYADMSPALAKAARRQDPMTMQIITALGPLKDLRFLRLTPGGEDAYEADFAHGKLELVVGPLTPDGKLDTLRWRPIWQQDGAPAQPGAPPPPIARAELPQAPLTPIANAELSQAPVLTLASVQVPNGTQLLGPGHYVQTSGPKKTGYCSLWSDWYSITTLPVAPGRRIENFHYQLRGARQCEKRLGDDEHAQCEVATDKPDKKTVRFKMEGLSDNCFGRTNQINPEFRRPVDPNVERADQKAGYIGQAEMVLSYDVR